MFKNCYSRNVRVKFKFVCSVPNKIKCANSVDSVKPINSELNTWYWIDYPLSTATQTYKDRVLNELYNGLSSRVYHYIKFI